MKIGFKKPEINEMNIFLYSEPALQGQGFMVWSCYDDLTENKARLIDFGHAFWLETWCNYIRKIGEMY
jgi:hypothetical protein